MRTIRYLAAMLMVITGILHLWVLFQDVKDPKAIPMLVFAVVYLAIGVLLFMDTKFSRILGIIFPLTGLGIGFGVIGLQNWDAMLTIMFIVDAIVVICCIVLLLNRKKVLAESQT